MKTLCETLPNFEVFAGNELVLLDILQIGGAGCISATTNLTSRLAARVKATAQPKVAGDLQEKLTAIRKEIQKYPLIPALKYLLASGTGNPSWTNMRPPLTALTQSEASSLEKTLEDLEFSKFCQ